VENGAPLHNAENDAIAAAELVEASPEEERDFLDSAKTESESARRYDLVETMRAYRDAKFKPAVLLAYSYKCAVCDCDLKLVDAAHIVPVSHPESTDEVTNGLALCRLHHGAFDNALLGIQSDYRLIVNPERVDRLREMRMASGFSNFKAGLPKRIRVPASIEVRPTPENLQLGLKLRRWPEQLIA
jgi:putative restriction endonuclease